MRETIELLINQIHKLYMYTSTLDPIKQELEQIIENSKMNCFDFAKRVMMTEEIRANDLVEGYLDDVTFIDEVVKKHKKIKNASTTKEQRILNLYNGYKYILKKEEITEDSLKKLYGLLSRNLLEEDDLNHMGEYYREAPVYIYYSNNPEKLPDEGINYQELSKYMNYLINYIHENHPLETMTDYYIKSQIIHFYFVFIHPYFDVNGRTSRTLSMWYLITEEIYPFIIFNRGINFDKKTYYKAIMETKRFGNITIFLKYMLENVKEELLKEENILAIEEQTGTLSAEERQALNYILSMKSHKTLKDFSSFYKRFNEHRPLKEINEQIILPLIDKNILEVTHYTQSRIYDGTANYMFKIKEQFGPSKIKK